MDFKAGCLAKIKTPIPVTVVIADSKIDVLYEFKFLLHIYIPATFHA